MNKLSSKLSHLETKIKILVPMTLIALMSVFTMGCNRSQKEIGQQITQERGAKDLNSKFIDMGQGIYYYPGSEDNNVSGEEVSMALEQFLSHHKDLEISVVIKEHYRVGAGYMTLITKSKEPCPCEDTTKTK